MTLQLQGALSAHPGSPQGTPSPRLVHAAHEFEAQMMKELLEPMARTSQSLDLSDSDDNSANALGSFATEALGRSLSDHGGLGIADRILKDIAHPGTTSQSGAAPGHHLSNLSLGRTK